jgi:hypothetical protein
MTEAYILKRAMRRFASFVAIFILLFFAAAPLLACTTGDAMNQEENACCRSTHGNCGEMAKTGRCRTENRTDELPQLATAAPSTDINWAVIATLSPMLAPLHPLSPSLLKAPDAHSPPGLVIAQLSVLRI